MPTAREVQRSMPGVLTFEEVSGYPKGSIVGTIASIGPEELGEEKKVKMVVRFTDIPKGLGLSKTNSDRLVDFFGDDELEGTELLIKAEAFKVNNRIINMLIIYPVD